MPVTVDFDHTTYVQLYNSQQNFRSTPALGSPPQVSYARESLFSIMTANITRILSNKKRPQKEAEPSRPPTPPSPRKPIPDFSNPPLPPGYATKRKPAPVWPDPRPSHYRASNASLDVFWGTRSTMRDAIHKERERTYSGKDGEDVRMAEVM